MSVLGDRGALREEEGACLDGEALRLVKDLESSVEGRPPLLPLPPEPRVEGGRREGVRFFPADNQNNGGSGFPRRGACFVPSNPIGIVSGSS